VPKHAIITSLNNLPTPTTDDFAAIYAGLKEGARQGLPLQFSPQLEPCLSLGPPNSPHIPSNSVHAEVRSDGVCGPGGWVPVQFFIHSERHRSKTALLHLHTKWYGRGPVL
jgi:hypothetical protein